MSPSALLCISIHSSIVSSGPTVGWRQNDVSRKLNPVISCRAVAGIALLTLLRSLPAWSDVGWQTDCRGGRAVKERASQGHVFREAGAGERSTPPVSPERDHGAVLCVLQMSRPHLDAASSRGYDKAGHSIVSLSLNFRIKC